MEMNAMVHPVPAQSGCGYWLQDSEVEKNWVSNSSFSSVKDWEKNVKMNYMTSSSRAWAHVSASS